MRFALSLLAVLAMCASSVAQECRYYSTGALSVEIYEDDTLTIFGSDGSETHCDIQHTEFNTVKLFQCPAPDGSRFEGDLYMIPSTIGGGNADIILMPPNALYFHCTTLT